MVLIVVFLPAQKVVGNGLLKKGLLIASSAKPYSDDVSDTVRVILDQI